MTDWVERTSNSRTFWCIFASLTSLLLFYPLSLTMFRTDVVTSLLLLFSTYFIADGIIRQSERPGVATTLVLILSALITLFPALSLYFLHSALGDTVAGNYIYLPVTVSLGLFLTSLFGGVPFEGLHKRLFRTIVAVKEKSKLIPVFAVLFIILAFCLSIQNTVTIPLSLLLLTTIAIASSAIALKWDLQLRSLATLTVYVLLAFIPAILLGAYFQLTMMLTITPFLSMLLPGSLVGHVIAENYRSGNLPYMLFVPLGYSPRPQKRTFILTLMAGAFTAISLWPMPDLATFTGLLIGAALLFFTTVILSSYRALSNRSDWSWHIIIWSCLVLLPVLAVMGSPLILLILGSLLGSVAGGPATTRVIARYKRRRMAADYVVIQLTRSDGAIYLAEVMDNNRSRILLHNYDVFLASRRLAFPPPTATEVVDIQPLLFRPSFEDLFILDRIAVRSVKWNDRSLTLIPNPPLQPVKSMDALLKKTRYRDQISKITVGYFVGRRDWRGLLERLKKIYPELDGARRYLVNLWVLEALQIVQFADVAFDIRRVLRKAIASAPTPDEVPERVRRQLHKKLKKHLEAGGSTVFIDLESMSQEEDLVPYSPEILSRRRLEFIEARRTFLNAPEPVPHGWRRFAYYEETATLWATAYGFSLLSPLREAIHEGFTRHSIVMDTIRSVDMDESEGVGQSTTFRPPSKDFKRFIYILMNQGVAWNLSTDLKEWQT